MRRNSRNMEAGAGAGTRALEVIPQTIVTLSDFRNYEKAKGSGNELEWRLANKEISKIVAVANFKECRDRAKTLIHTGNRHPLIALGRRSAYSPSKSRLVKQ